MGLPIYAGPELNGLRDPDYPCDAFESGAPGPFGDCETDGHYLCDECTRRATCEGYDAYQPPDGCGERPSRCVCVSEDELVDRAVAEWRIHLQRRKEAERRRDFARLFE